MFELARKALKSRMIQAAIITSLFGLIGVILIIVFQKSTTNTELKYSPQSMDDSPGGIQVQGNLIKNEYPEPELRYEVTQYPNLEQDGYYHASYKVYLFHAFGADIKRDFKQSGLISCGEPKQTELYVENGKFAETIIMDCRMKELPPEGTELFYYIAE